MDSGVKEAPHLFSEFDFSGIHLRNRTVRSATADAEVYNDNRIEHVTLDRYARLATNEIGMIITGDFVVLNPELLAESAANLKKYSYDRVRIDGFEGIVEAVSSANPDVALVAQLAAGNIMRLPSLYDSPFGDLHMEVFTDGEIAALVKAFGEAARFFQDAGYHGVQIHAAHGGALSLFLSPFTNTRGDRYGEGSLIFKEIRSSIRDNCGSFPVLIKINCTDYMPGGLDRGGFHRLVRLFAGYGYDAIEVSGGIWDCLCQSAERLGFPPRPSAESHTCLHKIENQSYFRPYVAGLETDAPLILAGGNYTCAICEDIIASGDAQMVSFCRPLIREPDMIKSWKTGRSNRAKCIACNACLYELYEHPGTDEYLPVRCVFNEDKELYREACKWGETWAEENFPG